MIHPEAIRKIRALLKHTLDNYKVENGMPVFSSYASNINGFAEEVIKHTKDWLNVLNIYHCCPN